MVKVTDVPVFDRNLTDLWTPTGILLGFQISLFTWRIEREVKFRDEGKQYWLTPADFLGVVGMMVLVFGLFLLPLAGFIATSGAIDALALGVLLFAGQCLGICGHYRLFPAGKKRGSNWFPLQEQIVVGLVILLSAVYIVFEPT
jgi:hypothetical protein